MYLKYKVFALSIILRKNSFRRKTHICVIICLESITRFIGKQNGKGISFPRHTTIKTDTFCFESTLRGDDSDLGSKINEKG